MHSSTKYLNGHGDALGGGARLLAFHASQVLFPICSAGLQYPSGAFGLAQAPQHHGQYVRARLLPIAYSSHRRPGNLEPWLLLRSLRTLQLRVERQSASAVLVARFLTTHKTVSKVHHPSLPHCEGRYQSGVSANQPAYR
jgi:O-acetylhomoserine/O-acetylserine sulfhydrylase-like pyridoxal-dependent enzyme